MFRSAPISAFIMGLVFSAGLVLSGMTLPQKITGFLDVAGQWDPSLMFVMLGALAVYASTFPRIQRLNAPLAESRFDIPANKVIDKQLVVGSVLFGMGWGLSGYCPGPAIASIATLKTPVLVFVGGMMLGMASSRITIIRTARAKSEIADG